VRFKEEFKTSPIQVTAAAIAIAIAVGGLFAGGLNIALPSIGIFKASWFPIYIFGAAIGVAGGLLAVFSFKRTWIFGTGATIGLLFASANVSARMVGFSGLELNGTEIFLNGTLCYIGFAGVLAERAYLSAKAAGVFDDEEFDLYGSGTGHMVIYGLMIPGFVFAGVYSGSLPNVLADLLK
jgi:hypothetical protein